MSLGILDISGMELFHSMAPMFISWLWLNVLLLLWFCREICPKAHVFEHLVPSWKCLWKVVIIARGPRVLQASSISCLFSAFYAGVLCDLTIPLPRLPKCDGLNPFLNTEPKYTLPPWSRLWWGILSQWHNCVWGKKAKERWDTQDYFCHVFCIQNKNI